MKPAAPKQLPVREGSLKHPGRWLWVLLLVPVLLGLLRLRFDAEVFDLLPDTLPVVKGLKLYQEHFANAQELIVTIEAASAEQAELAAGQAAARLRSEPKLVESVVWQPPWLEHPEQAAELIAYLWLNTPPEAFDQLTNRLAPERLPEILAQAKDDLASSMSPQEIGRLSYDPFGFTHLPQQIADAAPAFGQGQELFVSSNGTFRILFIRARPLLRTYRECQQWLKSVKELIATDGARTSPVMKIGYTGRPAFVSEIAAGMQHDMSTSVAGTAAIIALLFWFAHRRIRPMLWLLILLAVILGCTLSLGGLLFGSINVVSMGFAAILLGLAVDYAVVHYQEALAQPHLSIPQIRHAIAPSIFWAAVTTISAFLVLNLGGLPGLGQLGSLVGIGVALAAAIMIFEFLPPLFPGRREEAAPTSASQQTPPPGKANGDESGSPSPQTRFNAAGPALSRMRLVGSLTITGFLLVTGVLILAFGFPKLDATANALRPRRSQAYEALEKIQNHFNSNRDPLWLVIEADTVQEVGSRLAEVHSALSRQLSNGVVSDFTLPTLLWPNPGFQSQNYSAALALAAERAAMRQAALTNGFASNAVSFAEGVLDAFHSAAIYGSTFWPTNPMSQWILDKLTVRTATNYFALGIINTRTEADTKTDPAKMIATELPRQKVWLSGWRLLGPAILARVQARMGWVVLPMLGLVVLSLLLAFRRLVEICLSLAVLGLSGLCVLAIMRATGWSWNLLNLMAVPLVLGTGVDYSIFMQLALRRYQGDMGLAWRSVGRALLLCGGTAFAGFGSLGLSSNAGMASLGRVCAAGIGCNMLIAVYLLPTWWRLWAYSSKNQPEPQSSAAPSSLYRAELWRLGLLLVRFVPAGLLHLAARIGVSFYYRAAPHRRAVVICNLLPALAPEKKAAAQTAARLFRNFAGKLVDLWRFEAGLSIDHLFGQTSGWEYFEQAQSQKRGILLLTPHLGNWEFGGPMLTGRGINLQVITLAEPGKAFTEMRLASRAKWKIETLVIGNNPLAFVEIIHRLEQGATVALLVDRPPTPTAVQVELFGHPFDASIAAAELARASGCALLPVYVPRVNGKYEAHILPPVPYERATLRDRAARVQLTQRILNSFEPVIRKHLDQWYHFVPVWPKQRKSSAENGTGRSPAVNHRSYV